MLLYFCIFTIALMMVIHGALLATKYATILSQSFRLSSYIVGFIVIAIISILPETFIVINSALTGNPEFGLGVLLGANIADLTLIIAILIFLAGRGLTVESRILKNHTLYPLILMLPIILGLDGHLSRVEGCALILTGGLFYYLALKKDLQNGDVPTLTKNRIRPILFLVLSMTLLLIGSYLTVTSAVQIAETLGISSVLIGMLIVSLGTTLPELVFSHKAMKADDDSLALGDILGTVLANATMVVGLLALIQPFSFPKTTIYVAGVFMVAAAFILFSLMRSGHIVTRKEAFVLFIFWLTFVFIETIISIEQIPQ